jgi:hypothetical protein
MAAFEGINSVKIAEWLGYKNRPYNQLESSEADHFIHKDDFPNWLLSPEGQSAIMGKLEERGVNFWNERDGDCRLITLGNINLADHDDAVMGRAETRQHALLLAVLAMLEGE